MVCFPFLQWVGSSMGRDDEARFTLGVRQEIVGQDELGAGNSGERYVDFAGLGDQANILAGAPEQPAAEALPARQGPRQLDLGFEAGKALVILRADQRPV